MNRFFSLFHPLGIIHTSLSSHLFTPSFSCLQTSCKGRERQRCVYYGWLVQEKKTHGVVLSKMKSFFVTERSDDRLL